MHEATSHADRILAYRQLLAWLIVAFRSPTHDSLVELDGADVEAWLVAAGLPAVAQSRRADADRDGDLPQLASEYVRLFVNAPRGAVAHLEAVAYLAEDGPEAQNEYLAALTSTLATAGLTVTDESPWPPDHLTMLLEYLLFAWSTAPPGEVPATDPFVQRYLAGWVPAMLERLDRADPPPFYRRAGQVLTAVLAP